MQNYLFQFPKAKIDVLTVEIDPDMVEVAKKFYGYVPTESNRIEITDGIVYAKEALARGELYDFIVLDACSNDKKNVVICPIEGFRNEETISTMAQIVNPTGGLVANIVAYENPDFKEEEIRKLFSKYFASCFLMKYLPEQRMLICSHRPEWTLKTQRKNVCHLVWEEVLFICVAGCRVEEELSSDRFRKWLAETVEHSKDLKGIFLLGWLEGREVDLQRKTAIRPKDQEAVKPFLDLIEDNCLTNLWIHRQNCFLLSAQDFQVQVHHEVFTQRMGEEFKNDPILFRLKEVDTVSRPWSILESAIDRIKEVSLKDEPPEY
ncbi:unnamed protein product, partial [Mesorhabditis spiculigera]